MAEVSFTIAGRSYTLACDPGEEARLSHVAKRVDKEAKALATAGTSLSEARLFMMTALILADKLDEAETTPAIAEGALPAADAEILRQVMDDAAARLSNLVVALPASDSGDSDDDGDEDGNNAA